jgi:hypothetical protein
MRNYIPLLRQYGHVYGIDRMDLNGTVDFILNMRRSGARQQSGALRSLRLEYAAMSTEDLIHEAKTKEFQLSGYCRPYRGENIRRCDLAYLRMIRNELARRAAGKARITGQDHLTHGRYTFA